MTTVHNLNSFPEDFADDPSFSSKMKTLYLGAAAGSERLYVNIDFVKPGGKSVKYHSHSGQEEFFLVLAGEGTLRVDGEEIPVTKGSFVAKPAGKGIAHQFINIGDEVLQILDCGLKAPSDVISYPDENVVLVKSERMVFKSSDALAGWSSDPNK